MEHTYNMKQLTELLKDTPMFSWVLGDKTRKIDLVYITCVEFIKWHNSAEKETKTR